MAVEFAQLVSPQGEWGRIWLAAHWEKRLKKQDYLEIDLRALIASFLLRRRILSLRATGHLLIGGCRIFARKCEFLEEDAQEVHEALDRLWSTLGIQNDQPKARPRGRGKRELAAEAAEALLAAESQTPQGDLLGGKRHVARLEDITLRLPQQTAAGTSAGPLAAAGAGAGGSSEELFGMLSDADWRLLQELVVSPLLPGDGAEDVKTADGLGRKRSLETNEEALVPLVLLPPPGAPDLEPPPGEEPADNVEAAEPYLQVPVIVDREVPKRRRKHPHRPCDIDVKTEIPESEYESFSKETSRITREKVLDYSILLPHHAPQSPRFTTPYTDLCLNLNALLQSGSEEVERMRKARFDEDCMADWAEGTALEPPTQQYDFLAEAPKTLSSAILQADDCEDSQVVRVGYSGRTEKMHKYLAREFQEANADALSYVELCKTHASGRRELVASSFFELLVLRTNGVIQLEQKDTSDIQISKASHWSSQVRDASAGMGVLPVTGGT